MKKKWNFMLDQGGTFTDIIAIRPDGKTITKKILSSEDTANYNPIRNGIKEILKENKPFTSYPVAGINIGTTFIEIYSNFEFEDSERRNRLKIYLFLICVTYRKKKR